MYLMFFHSSCTDTCWPQHTTLFDVSFPLFLIHENPLFFWLPLELLTVFPFFLQTVKAYCRAAYTSLSCCTVFALASAINHSSNIAPAFAISSAFSLPSVTNFSRCDIFCFSFFVRCALTCSTSTKISFEISRCNSSQILNHKSASPALGLMQSHSSP